MPAAKGSIASVWRAGLRPLERGRNIAMVYQIVNFQPGIQQIRFSLYQSHLSQPDRGCHIRFWRTSITFCQLQDEYLFSK